jgi:hypothetical protein
MRFDLNGRKAAYGGGLLTGMIVVAAPHLIGTALLLCILVLVLKLVEKDRL